MTTLTDAGRAWRELLDLLREADQTFLEGPRAELDALGVAEGYRHLSHLLSYAFDLYLEADPERPVFTALAGPTRKILGDNVDSRYFFAPLRGDRRYRIRGRHGVVPGVFLVLVPALTSSDHSATDAPCWSSRVVPRSRAYPRA